MQHALQLDAPRIAVMSMIEKISTAWLEPTDLPFL
jgi:hypothetical protein